MPSCSTVGTTASGFSFRAGDDGSDNPHERPALGHHVARKQGPDRWVQLKQVVIEEFRRRFLDGHDALKGLLDKIYLLGGHLISFIRSTVGVPS